MVKEHIVELTFPDGLIKNQKLDFQVVITPTTKGKVDKPISKDDIINEGYMTSEECEFIYRKATELILHMGEK